MERLKPTGISHTVYPDQPANDYNEWSAHIASREIVRDLDEFKRKFDSMFNELKTQILNSYA